MSHMSETVGLFEIAENYIFEAFEGRAVYVIFTAYFIDYSIEIDMYIKKW